MTPTWTERPETANTLLLVLAALTALPFAFGVFAFGFWANIYVDGHSGADVSQIIDATFPLLSMFMGPGAVVAGIAYWRNDSAARITFGVTVCAVLVLFFWAYSLAPMLLFTVAFATYYRGFRSVPIDLVALLTAASIITFILYGESTR